jgi:hypothetical protein
LLTIREAQLAALAAAAEESFEHRLYVHAVGLYPGLLMRLGEAGVRDAIRSAVRACRQAGWRAAGDVAQFVSIYCEALCDPDEDPAEAARKAKLALRARDVFNKLKAIGSTQPAPAGG